MASPRCQKTRPHHTRTPCQEVPEGPEPWTWPVSNVAFWFEENKVQNCIPKMPKKRAPTTPEHRALQPRADFEKRHFKSAPAMSMVRGLRAPPGKVFWRLIRRYSWPRFLSKAMSRLSVWRRWAFCFHCFATQRSQEQVLPFVFLCLTWIRPLSSFGQTCAPHFGQLWLYMLGGMTFPSLTLKRCPQTRRWSRTILSRANPLDLGVGGGGGSLFITQMDWYW